MKPVNLDKLASQPCYWLRDGARDSDVVVSSTIRLSRNLDGFSFVGHATTSDLSSVVQRVVAAVPVAFPGNDVAIVDPDELLPEEA